MNFAGIFRNWSWVPPLETGDFGGVNRAPARSFARLGLLTLPLHVCEVSCAEAGGRRQPLSLEDVRGQPTPSNLWHEATTAIVPTTAE